MIDFEGINGLDPATIDRRIRAFEALGIHRTGWPGDDRSAALLRDELKTAGVPATFERFDFIRVEYRKARASWPNGYIDGVPMYDGGFTDFGGLRGELCEESDPDPFGKIMLGRNDERWHGPEVRVFYDELFEKGIIGAIVPASEPGGRAILRDATHIRTPFDIPVLQVSARDGRDLASANVLGGLEVTLEADGERLKSRAQNVIATVPGTDADAEPIVVLAQRSGWFTAAGERGTGLAIWLALAEAIAREQPSRPVQFLAASGAELGNTGLAFHLRAHPGLAKRTVTFLDLGPSLGANEATVSVTASDDELLDAARAAIEAHAPSEVTTLAPGDPGASSTAKSLATAGPRYVSFDANHASSHSAADTTDAAVNVDATAAWTRVALTVLRSLTAAG